MTAPDVVNFEMQTPECIPINRVADDMAAIFGSATRMDSPLSAQTVRQAKIARRRSPLVAVLAIVGLATMLAAGVLTGENALNGEPESAEPRTSHHERTAIARSVPKSETIVAGTSALEPEGSEALSSVKGSTVRALAHPIISTRLTTSIERDGHESGPPAIQKSELVVIHPNQAAASTLPVRMPKCIDGSGCLQSKLYTADRDLTGVYDDAASAGVNARDLRAYRKEWLRARSLVADRPKEALRIYGMITSDLRLFTDEASGPADGDIR